MTKRRNRANERPEQKVAGQQIHRRGAVQYDVPSPFFNDRNIKVEDIEKALEKQKPKKPIMIEGYIYGVCPSCHNILEVGRYCWNCGQAIDHISRFGQRFDNEQGE